MKREVLRISNGILRRGRVAGGPFFIRLYRGSMTGVVIDESFEKELITDFFTGKSELTDGYFFFQEALVPPENCSAVLRKRVMRELAIITDESRLFPSLTIVDNLFLPAFGVRTGKHRKIARELMDFFDISIPLNTKVADLTPLQRIQLELLHAVTNHRKLILAMHLNSGLRQWEQEELYRLYDRLLSSGYAICLFESLSTMPLERLDLVSVVEKGMCIGEYLRQDIDRDVLMRLVNAYGDARGRSEIMHMRDWRLYNGVRLPVIRLRDVTGESVVNLNLTVHKGEITELHCRSRKDYAFLRRYLVGRAGNGCGGQLLIGDKEVSQREVRKRIGRWRIGVIDLALLDHMLFENLSLLENLCYPLCRKVPGFFLRPRYMRAAGEYLSRIGSELAPDTPVRSLTEEQAARAVFCRWVLCKPEILLVFIPSSFVRIEFDITLNRLLLELSMYGIPILLISERYKLEADVIESEYILDHADEGRLSGHLKQI